ncbi:N-acetylmuramoyl-L-alanine amidase [Dellaglioa carnosa]|nr:N-acetylmuramoyl-L-alanine amidase [Dellaglioa carnosa]MCZ2493960.1 N-acetylmuramoyl-L-alanine amidase [Dellaglioa carnosa]
MATGRKQGSNINWPRVILLIIIFFTLCLGVAKTMSYLGETVVESDNINVRTGPSTSFKVTNTLKKGERISIIREKNNWSYVLLPDDKKGWVANWLLAKKNATVTKLSEATIVLDPGHGGNDSGALSIKKKQEKIYTLQMAIRVANLLKARGANVLLTRDSDSYVGLTPRAKLAESNNADAFISFHFDSSPNDNEATGLTSYYYKKSTDLALASALNVELNNTGLNNRGTEFGDFLVLRENTQPSVLLELGYINTKYDFKLIQNDNFQEKTAESIVKGLDNYFKNK